VIVRTPVSLKIIQGAACTFSQRHLPLNPPQVKNSLTVRALANEVVIGLMSVTLAR